ncbi:MAG TPA: hypothetical protein VGN12_27665 [Pirellulales bacterium]|jgi:hypothetical protein
MRLFVCSLVILLCLGTVGFAADDVDEEMAEATVAEKTVTVDGHDLQLAYEAEADGDTIEEFIPADETLENWTRMAAIRTYEDVNDPMAVAEAVAKQLKEQKPPIDYDLLQNSETGDVAISFIVWGENAAFAEFNVFQYKKLGDSGLAMYQYALRAYDVDVDSFIESLDPETRMKQVAVTVKFGADQAGTTQDEKDDEKDE